MVWILIIIPVAILLLIWFWIIAGTARKDPGA
jgi:hypothetical protein